jgi:tetratricopeptide (TPR) repeat protein
MRSHPFLRFVSAMFVAAFAVLLARGDTVEDYLKQAQRALMNKEADKAKELADKAIAADPKDARGYLLRGDSYEVLRRHDKAIADFTKCLDLNPKLAAAYNHRGSEQFKLGRIRESLAEGRARTLAARHLPLLRGPLRRWPQTISGRREGFSRRC